MQQKYEKRIDAQVFLQEACSRTVALDLAQQTNVQADYLKVQLRTCDHAYQDSQSGMNKAMTGAVTTFKEQGTRDTLAAMKIIAKKSHSLLPFPHGFMHCSG